MPTYHVPAITVSTSVSGWVCARTRPPPLASPEIAEPSDHVLHAVGLAYVPPNACGHHELPNRDRSAFSESQAGSDAVERIVRQPNSCCRHWDATPASSTIS